MNSRNEPSVNLKKVCLIVLAVYLVLTVGFYFLAGEQLRYRDSRGNVSRTAPEIGTIELAQGTVVEQHFELKIQRLKTISLQWGAYYRANTGTVNIELWDMRAGKLLLSQQIDAVDILEGGVTVLEATEPLEDVYQVPLVLRLYSNSQPGSAVSPLMNLSQARKDWVLTVNGQDTEGMLCFAASGQDYIWTGIHYWSFVFVGLLLLLIFLAQVRRREKRGHSYVVNALIAVQKYRFLIRQLVSRDFKAKYKRSVLGMFWSFLNPLLTMLVQYMVFSTIFKSDISNYPAYLLIGLVSFNFFSEASGMALNSILGNAGLITKVYMPKYIYPLTRVMSSGVNLVISLIPMVLVCIITGVQFKRAAVLSFYFLVCIIIFSLGIGLLLASAMVFFRDTQFLWGVLSMIWMYMTPIFYPETILPENFRFILQINPLYHFIKYERMCILDGISPEPVVYVQCLVMALAILLAGAMVFRRSQDKFVLYL